MFLVLSTELSKKLYAYKACNRNSVAFTNVGTELVAELYIDTVYKYLHKGIHSFRVVARESRTTLTIPTLFV